MPYAHLKNKPSWSGVVSLCSVCNISFTKKHWKQKFCSPECQKKFKIIRHRKYQDAYRVKNWEKIKIKNNKNFNLRKDKDPTYPNKLYRINIKNNPEGFKRRAAKQRERIRNDPVRLEKRRATINKWQKEKRKTDPFHRIRGSLTNRLNSFLKKKSVRKNTSILSLIGCSKEELVKHIELQFYNNPTTGEIMSWNNYGKYLFKGKNVWNIDHVKPISIAKTMEDIVRLKLMNFKNLRPLWAVDNMKKSDLIDGIRARDIKSK